MNEIKPSNKIEFKRFCNAVAKNYNSLWMMEHAVENGWNRCEVCGQFIAFSEFADGTSEHNLVYPDSEITVETWETFHKSCNDKSKQNGR